MASTLPTEPLSQNLELLLLFVMLKNVYLLMFALPPSLFVLLHLFYIILEQLF